MKSRSSISWKASSKRRAPRLNLSEARDKLLFATFLTLGIIACSLGIGVCRGAWRGELDSIRDALAIGGVLAVVSSMAPLLYATLILIGEVAIWSFRRVTRWRSRKPKVVGGVADQWLDGPA
jgi:hypothetical protein